MFRTTCPPRPELVAYSLGTLPPQEIESIADHIDACETCQSALATLSDATDPLVDQLRQPVSADEYAHEEPCRRAIARVRAFVPALAAAASVPSPHESEPLPQLGEYVLLAKLGEGGMGAVYRAQHTKLDKLVALKVVRKDRMQDPRTVSRFEREMKAVGRLSHPNIVQAFDAREIDGTHFLAMEYVEGMDLAKLVSATGALRIADACELVRQAAVGLQHAHEQGLVHRDIKPSNLMLSVVSGQWSVVTDHGQRTTSHGQLTTDFGQQAILKILDFGLSLLGVDQPNRPEMTAAGTAMGTADYVSPEQVTDSHSVDIRSDIYSLGCTLYKLLSGRAPFVGPEFKNDVTKMMAHVNKVPPPISLLRTDLPPGLAAVVERMMAKRPDDRFATPGEVAAALEPFASGSDLRRLLDETHGTPGLPAVAAPPSASTGKLTSSAYSDTASLLSPARPEGFRPSSPLAPVLRGEGPGVRAGSGRRRIQMALIAAAAAIPLLLGVWVIIRDKSGKEVGRMQIPEGGSATVVDEQGKVVAGGKLTTEHAETSPVVETSTRPAEKPLAAMSADKSPQPVSIQFTPEPLVLAAGAPMSKAALVAQPPPVPGLRSWTIEAVGHRGSVNGLAISPDGKTLATACSDGALRLWNVDTRDLVRVIIAHDGPANDVAWSPDGMFLATSGDDQTVRIWEAQSGLRVLTLPGDGPIGQIAWSATGCHVAGVTQRTPDPGNAPPGRGTAVVWEFRQPDGPRPPHRKGWEPVASGVKRKTLLNWVYPTTFCSWLSWSPNGRTLAVGWGQQRLLWDLETEAVVDRASGGSMQDRYCWSAAWSPDGRHIAFGSHADVVVYDPQSRQMPRTLTLEPPLVWATSLSWSHDGKSLAAGLEFRFCAWDVDTGKVIADHNRGHGVPIHPNDLMHSLDDKTLVVGFNSGRVEFQPIGSTTAISSLPCHCGSVSALTWSPDAERLATASLTTGRYRTWNTSSGKLIEDTFEGVWGLSWSPDNTIMARSNANRFVLQDTMSKKTAVLRDVCSSVLPAVWAPDCQILALRTYDKPPSVALIRRSDASIIARLPAQPSAAATFSPDGHSLALGDGTEVRVCDPQKPDDIATLWTAPAPISAISWSPDRQTIAVGSKDRQVYLFDVASKKVRTTCQGHQQPALVLGWGQDGGELLSGNAIEVCVWEAGSGKLLRTIPDDCGAISADGRLLASRGESAIRLRQTEDGTLLRTIVSLCDKQYAAVSPEGHFRGSPDVEHEFVYVALTEAGQQITLTPAEFAEKYGWKNDPAKVTMLPEPSPQQPAISGESAKHAD